MNIDLLSPVPNHSYKGNNVTVNRWERVLNEIGNDVQVIQDIQSADGDLLIALHARRSADAISKSQNTHPDRPVILALTGTDVYRDIHENDQAAQSLEKADYLVVLQSKAIEELPEHLRNNVQVVHQSIESVPIGFEPRPDVFEVAVIGHLRSVKDPFRTARAVRQLPDDSKIEVIHLGQELETGFKRQAIEETRNNERYRWIDVQPRRRTMQILARSDLMVISSLLEGGANVVSEAIACTTPVIASKISGNVGLLGENYPGYYPPESTEDLAEILFKAETENAFYDLLREHIQDQYPIVDPENERNQWNRTLQETIKNHSTIDKKILEN